MISRPILRITIPALPPSFNSMYEIHYATRKVMLKKEAKRWTQSAAAFMGPCEEFTDTGRYKVRIEYHGCWFQKAKPDEPKEKDVRNYEKLITDTVFRRYGVSDKRIWISTVSKVEGTDGEEKVVYEVSRLGEAGGEGGEAED